jgi:uncharacterized YccA/Bax inhibitor family protein
LLGGVLLTAAWTWSKFFGTQDADAVLPWAILGAVGGLIVALATVLRNHWAPVTAPLYALLEGLVIGGVSSFLEFRFPGIVIQAAGLTLGVLVSLLLAYKTRLIQATENFKLGVVAATGGIALMYLVSFGFGLFGVRMPFIHDTGIIGIGLSVFIVVIAALNLVLDFDFIEKGADRGAPKHMEWYAAFGLLVTLIWLYLEILRLLAKTRSRR